jgi:hypothetical protein
MGQSFRPESLRAGAGPPTWLQPRGWAFEGALVPGVDVVLRLRDGRIYVGKVVAAPAWGVALQPWGRPLALRIASSAIAGASVVGEHSYAEASEVRRRQARGLPAWAPNGP